MKNDVSWISLIRWLSTIASTSVVLIALIRDDIPTFPTVIGVMLVLVTMLLVSSGNAALVPYTIKAISEIIRHFWEG